MIASGSRPFRGGGTLRATHTAANVPPSIQINGPLSVRFGANTASYLCKEGDCVRRNIRLVRREEGREIERSKEKKKNKEKKI